jgi:hypothetical protein
MVTQAAEDRFAAHRRTAERMLQEIILPALTTARDELHRSARQQYVTVTPRSSTSAALIVARTPPPDGDGTEEAAAADGLRYVLSVGYGPQAIVVQRRVNGQAGTFLGQHHASSLRAQTIVDDVRRVWRRLEQQHEARRS